MTEQKSFLEKILEDEINKPVTTEEEIGLCIYKKSIDNGGTTGQGLKARNAYCVECSGYVCKYYPSRYKYFKDNE